MPGERDARAGIGDLLAPLAAIVLLAAFAGAGEGDGVDDGCVGCHAGLEEMHPWEPLGCVDCHGGDGAATEKEVAHVSPRVGWPKDERVVHSGFEPEFTRFRNPSDLRVLSLTCGTCHDRIAEHLRTSLHGTTAGHLNDGLYENGVNPTREAVYGIFPVTDERETLPPSPHVLAELTSIERLRQPGRTRRRSERSLGDHFTDLPRKACMQCHLWSEGVALPGRLGQDGLYRSSGCAACHVTYAEDGLTRSGDASIDRFEPGHPLRHELTAAPPTETCTSCHVGDASIGNGFRGLAQLYPNMPAGPDVPGTTDRLVAGQFFIEDPLLTPPDLHRAAGMHCVDCHTARDVMGDGNVYGAMEHGVEIECTSCHGTFGDHSDLKTSRGRPIRNLARSSGVDDTWPRFTLTGKVTDRSHRVKQARDVVDPDHPDYNPRAAAAMTPAHARLECYACHYGWSTNFFGFHFDRNEQFTQLDLISGHRTPGVVSTGERVFATLRQPVLGINSEGRIAPYMVGFSTMGTVHGPDGELLVDQGLPETAAGLSGMSLIHHQTHTNQPAARSCVECHRSPATWGLGTGGDTGGSFSLARGLIVAVGERGVETLLLDRENPEQSIYLARLPLGGARAVTLDADVVTGRASTAFVVIEQAGVGLVDVRQPAFPRVLSFVAAGDAHDVALAGDLLLVANGDMGLRIVDVSDRSHPRLLSDLATVDARGLSVQWPRVFVADGAGGLLVADVSVSGDPRIVGQARCTTDPQAPDDARAVATIFQYGRPQGQRTRTPARLLAIVANGDRGASLLDVTEPAAIDRLGDVGGGTSGLGAAVDVTVTGRFELGDTTGAVPTTERDVAYVTFTRVLEVRGPRATVAVLDVTEPARPGVLDLRRDNGGGAQAAVIVRSFNPPELVTRLLVASDRGLLGIDATRSEETRTLFVLTALTSLHDVAVEAFAFDRLVNESGRQLKDISHEGARYLEPAEIHRILTLPGETLGILEQAGERRADLTAVYGSHGMPGGVHARGRAPVDDGNLPIEREERLALGQRLASSESLARLVRHMDWMLFDRNRDEVLQRAELERLVFAVLDANDDGVLDVLEWPRHPHADPLAMDRNRDGVLKANEMDLDASVFRYFDLDGNDVVDRNEWPWQTLDEPHPSFYYVTPEALFEIVNASTFEARRPELRQFLLGPSITGAQRITAERLESFVERAAGRPLTDLFGEPVLGDFLVRWDIDGDGAVTQDEHREFARVAERCDLDGDGDVDRRDVP